MGGKTSAAADKAGQSVNAYILQAVQQRMARDKGDGNDGNLL